MQSKPFKTILLSKQKLPHEEIVILDQFKIGLFTLKNEHSSENEDCMFLSKAKTIRMGVADGAGGYPRGEDASFIVCDEMKEETNAHPIEQIERANENLLKLKVGARTTLAFAEIIGDRVSFHTAGDSEIVYWNSTGKELYTSIPHSTSGYKVAAGVSTQQDSLNDPDRHYVNNLIGDSFVRISSTTPQTLKKGHRFLIGSDGLFDNLTHDQLNSITQGVSFESSFGELVRICKEQDANKWIKKDDISFIFLKKVK